MTRSCKGIQVRIVGLTLPVLHRTVTDSEKNRHSNTTHGRNTGQNDLHTDMYMLAKAFAEGGSSSRTPGSVAVMKAALREIMAANDRRQEPDYKAITRIIREVELVD